MSRGELLFTPASALRSPVSSDPDSLGTCSSNGPSRSVCPVDGVFCAVERHNDTRQELPMPRISASTRAPGRVSQVLMRY